MQPDKKLLEDAVYSLIADLIERTPLEAFPPLVNRATAKLTVDHMVRALSTDELCESIVYAHGELDKIYELVVKDWLLEKAANRPSEMMTIRQALSRAGIAYF